MTSAPELARRSPPPVGSVPEGKRVDFLTGRIVDDSPGEYVRQNIERALIRQYRYSPADCEVDFPIRVGSARRRMRCRGFPTGAGAYPTERIHSNRDEEEGHAQEQQN